jgi:hypothetical protein
MFKKIDINVINKKIINNFIEKYNKLEEYKKQQELLKNILLKNQETDERIKNNIQDNIIIIDNIIDDIINEKELNFYLNETLPLINEYNNILKIPIKMNFLGVLEKDQYEEKKEEIIKKFLIIVNKYIKDNDLIIEQKKEQTCSNCNNNIFDNIDDNTYVCINCSTEFVTIKNTSSYKDVDRVNICTKYTYNRKVHFRDCINQYQGKQNCTINQEIYDQLDEQFKIHSLLQGNENDSKEYRYERITKDIIMMFLKELGYSKHYENVNLIHYNITGKKPDDISHLEEKLMHDFDQLTELYDKIFVKKINRNNFINTQYVLYQLLKRHKHPCKKNNFSVLKTIDRISFHDDVVKILFQQLGWNHDSYF